MRHLIRRSLLSLAIAVLAVGGGWLSLPRVTVACSCVGPEQIIEMAAQQPESTVFTAIAGPKAGRDIPVVVTRWFRGVPAIGPMIIEGGPDDDMCGPTSPAAGGEFLFVTYQSETSRYAINGCSVQVDVSTPEGQALVARTVGWFGPGAAPSATDPPPQAPDDPAGDVAAILAPAAIVSLFALGLVGGALLVLRRRQDR